NSFPKRAYRQPLRKGLRRCRDREERWRRADVCPGIRTHSESSQRLLGHQRQHRGGKGSGSLPLPGPQLRPHIISGWLFRHSETANILWSCQRLPRQTVGYAPPGGKTRRYDDAAKCASVGRSGSAEAYPETHCNVIAVRLLTIAVLQPIVSPLLSISCVLITLYVRPFWFKNDGTVVTLARTAFDASCAAMVPQLLYTHSGLVFRQLPKLCARELHKLVRRHARAVRTALVRLGDECDRLSFERRGAVLCTEPAALVDTPVVNCRSLRAGRRRTVCMGWCQMSGKVSLV